jgi:hypothetical protein
VAASDNAALSSGRAMAAFHRITPVRMNVVWDHPGGRGAANLRRFRFRQTSRGGGTKMSILLAKRGEEIACMDINPQTADFSEYGKQVRVMRSTMS